MPTRELDVAIRANIDVIADLGNCWMDRDYEDTVRRAGPRIAMVQFADAVFGSAGVPPPGGRVVPGDGDLPMTASSGRLSKPVTRAL